MTDRGRAVASPRRWIVVVVAVLLFGLLFLARLRIGDPDEAILYMLVVPIGGSRGRWVAGAAGRLGTRSLPAATDLSTVDP